MQPRHGYPFFRQRLRYDQQFYAELQICNEFGIPHSEFLSWNYDDRAKSIAFVIEKGLRCSLCGTAQWEWDEDKYAYESVSQFCQGCYMKHITEDDNALPGTTITLLPTTGQAAAKRRVREQRLTERMSSDNG